jgi:hypothetical protein
LSGGVTDYSSYDGPIYQILLDDFYRLRSGAILSIISILFIFFLIIIAFLTAFIVLNIYLVFLAPILACLGVIFGICCLVTTSPVFNCTGAGFVLFVVGILLELIVITLLSIVAGRLNEIGKQIENKENEPMYVQYGKSPTIVRRIRKRRI